MILKHREKSKELLILESLHARMELTKNEKSRFRNLARGFEGEQKFDRFIEDLSEERYVLNDLLLEVNQSYFQLDTVIISQEAVYLLDSKYYEGDFYFDSSGKFFAKKSNFHYKNPVDQLNRSVILFGQFLRQHQLSFITEPLVIFIHPEFTLYQAPMDLPIIFPTQLPRFIRMLDESPSTLASSHKKLAQLLLTSHCEDYPGTVLPTYEYEQLRKGVCCLVCQSFRVVVQGKVFGCQDCGARERFEDGVVRSVHEFQRLFPERILTRGNIEEWCGGMVSKKSLNRILKKHYELVKKSQLSYYI
ncbi:hypothetical protein Q73_16440 [Bacillus coahuilensis m2-6]|uniref:nuclease-related domain-containing protein n=1 Tax=Bacillus coahuilensis TaxID=408580 RepID=UPI000185121E|nr:nuclease-related domain-containing protein [Bacillus coahuilensis]KUP04071.1 hypothetical protein Q73_16440 [Bacillus coahuilensis m2-6]